MPPIKGRMLNPQRPIAPPIHCFKSAFSGKKNLRPKTVATIGKQTAEKALKKLRIPESLCKSLPSVRRFKDKEAEITETSKARTIDPSPVIILDDDEENVSQKFDFIAKKSKCGSKLYHCKQILEAKFGAMIWDVAFIPNGGIIVSHASGALLCDSDLGIKQVLENVRMGGGVAVFPDGRFVVICRFNDTVNVYSPLGIFQQSLAIGQNPTSLAINNKCEMIICDIGTKCVHIVDENGKVLRNIPSSVNGKYCLQWPEYVVALPDNSILVCDVHMQRVIRFNYDGLFEEQLQLKTCGNQAILRPHGVCIGPSESIFVVDSATDSVEVFSKRGQFVQTLLSLDEGRQLKVKVVRVDNTERRLLIGGLTGTVKLLNFMDAADEKVAAETYIKSEADLKVRKLILPKKELLVPIQTTNDEVIVLD